MRIPPVSEEFRDDESFGSRMPPKIAAMVKLLTSVGSIASDFEDVEFRYFLNFQLTYFTLIINCSFKTKLLLTTSRDLFIYPRHLADFQQFLFATSKRNAGIIWIL